MPQGAVSSENELRNAFRIPLFLASVVGIPSILQTPQELTNPSWFFKLKTLLSVIVIPTLLLLNLVFNAVHVAKSILNGKTETIGKFAGTVAGLWWWSSGFLMFMYFVLCRKGTSLYFLAWDSINNFSDRTSAALPLFPIDSNLKRDVNLIFIGVLLSATIDAILYHVYAMRDSQDSVNSLADFLQHHIQSNQYVEPYVSGSSILAALHLCLNKLNTFVLNFGDILIMMISRAIYGQFRSLLHYVDNNTDSQGVIPHIQPGICWKRFRKSFFKAVQNMRTADRTFHIIIWISYETNIFFICHQLSMGIQPPNPSSLKLVHRVYVAWSFFHLILRTLAVNVIAAQINQHCNRLHRQILLCASECYSDDVRRTERFLQQTSLGLSGNGMFVVTRPFILTIIGAMFTVEVVLLQNVFES